MHGTLQLIDGTAISAALDAGDINSMDTLSKATRTAAKGSGWSVKRDVLSRQIGKYALAVHPRRGSVECIEFRAKPIVWDQTLWSILQIEGNEKQPVSFHFLGAFTCDCPALIQETLVRSETPEETAEKMTLLASRALAKGEIWQNFNLLHAAGCEQPQAAYRYHMTHVIERIESGDRRSAQLVCELALSGELDLRSTFSSIDNLSAPDADGRRESRSFFELAQLWMNRNKP